MNIIIGISWPFANGELHIGHAASSLPGDVIARYHRLKGDKVILVSGTDCHGTPIEVKALQENKSSKEIVDECHVSFAKDFKDFGISFDLYNRTDDPYHKEFVREQFVKYYNNGYLEEKEEEQLYCNHCKLFLADRYIIGICPKCGTEIKGDECEKCRSLLTIDEVKETKCAICGCKTTYKKNKSLYFKLSNFQKEIKQLQIDLQELEKDYRKANDKKYEYKGPSMDNYQPTDEMKTMSNSELNQGLQLKIKKQDQEIDDIILDVKKGKVLAKEAVKIMDDQNKQLDELQEDIDRLDSRLKRGAKRFENYVAKKSGCCIVVILVLEFIAGILIYTLI